MTEQWYLRAYSWAVDMHQSLHSWARLAQLRLKPQGFKMHASWMPSANWVASSSVSGQSYCFLAPPSSCRSLFGFADGRSPQQFGVPTCQWHSARTFSPLDERFLKLFHSSWGNRSSCRESSFHHPSQLSHLTDLHSFCHLALERCIDQRAATTEGAALIVKCLPCGSYQRSHPWLFCLL